MLEYHDQRQCLTRLFEKYLAVMVQRRSRTGRQDCAIIFKEDAPSDDAQPALRATARVARSRVRLGLESRDGGAASNNLLWEPCDAGNADGGTAEKKLSRYVQFAFMDRTFFMDLPNDTLFSEEVRVLLESRPGFFFLRDRRCDFMGHEEWVEEFRELNPVEKEYLNDDLRTAADDAAFVFLTLWKFPADWQFYYRALAFWNPRRRWEGTGIVM
jgi:hypothetical protein